MLKWAITARKDALREVEQSNLPFRTPRKSPRARHKRLSNAKRRSSISGQKRNSLDLEIDKENRFTSTPIKLFEELQQFDPLKDVSNVSFGNSKRGLDMNENNKSAKKFKKSKDDFNGTNYFQQFESVDSHIEGVSVINSCSCNRSVRKSTLPSYSNFAFSPFPSQIVNRNPTPIVKMLHHEETKSRIDHVNDFLQQISFITSPEEDNCNLELKSATNLHDNKLSPLVKQFLNLKFKMTQESQKKKSNDSSCINEMSLNEIVEAILDSSEKNLSCKNDKNENIDDDENRKESDQTVININETFRERNIDTKQSRKRSMDSNDSNSEGFTLKRQRCIRRRRIEEHRKSEPTLNDTSFISSLNSEESQHFVGTNDRTPPFSELKVSDIFAYKTSSEETPTGASRRFKRCLFFDQSTTDRSSISEIEPLDDCYSLERHRGLVDLIVEEHDNELCLHVIRCRNLQRPGGDASTNAYVKIIVKENFDESRNHILYRTSVQANSISPQYNHTFKIPLQDSDMGKRLHIEVWHRDRISRTSEFLGCMSFSIQDECKNKVFGGSYRLLPQSLGRYQNSPVTSQSNTLNNTTMCENSQSSIEEILSLDDIENELKPTNKTILSEQQKQADENLFLRYLELDPLEGPEAIPAATQRRAVGNKNGRTPFTQTKRLIRSGKSGFGFSVVWTHPPRIERVEKGLPADRAGILPGDYIIFVDKHNVVMTPEIEILNLIRSHGCQLTLEIFRRQTTRNGSLPSVKRLNSTGTVSTAAMPTISALIQRRPSTVCSTNTPSLECNRKKLHLPQVTFSAEKSNSTPEDNRKKAMYQLISKEQQYATRLQFGITRFVSALAERRDLITPSEHKILFQNCEELLRITEDILDQLIPEDGESQIQHLCKVYLSKVKEITYAYKIYCSGIKKADCVLANKMKNTNSEFVRFLQTPEIPKRRPDITTFIHKPLEHYREILKLLIAIQSLTKNCHDEHSVINQIVHDLQVTYREITVEAGLMEPVGEGRPLLSIQDLENRIVFTKCKPFVLNKSGRQWVFGGDLGRVEGRNVRQYWTLLFNDLLLFAKVSRDRVLFVMEEPLPLLNVTDMFFNIRKKDTEFRIVVAPGGKPAFSPTVHCGPDLTKTPKKNANKKTIILRAPTIELKAVWQNLLKRQIFQINSGIDGSSFSSPLDSPEVPITSSVATLQSAESFSLRRQTPHSVNQNNNTENQRQIDAIIENKCKQMNKSNNSSKGSTTYLENWMKGQLDEDTAEAPGLEPIGEEWSLERLRKRSEELHLIDHEGNVICRNDPRRSIVAMEESIASDHDQSPSKSTTTESQVTVRTSPLVPGSLPVCRQCHKNCLTNSSNKSNGRNCNINTNEHRKETVNENNEWQPLLLMGLAAIDPAASLLHLDPFMRKDCQGSHQISKDRPCLCNQRLNSSDLDFTPDDSPQTEEHPYHSLSSSNLTIRRFGTVSSLEKLAAEDNLEESSISEERESSESESDENECHGIDNEGFNPSSILSWTAKASSFVAEKMSFFGDDYRSGGRFFERYLSPNKNQVNGDDNQEDEASGATSGEEIWGTPTSGGEMDENFSSPNYEEKLSPYGGSFSSDNNDDTEFMMDELLMTPPISGAVIRGLLPRRTLEPLIEEDFTDTTSSSSSPTPTEPSTSPEQGKLTGDAADTCSTAAEENTPPENTDHPSAPSTAEVVEVAKAAIEDAPRIHRAESYRRIVEAAEEDEDDTIGFFNRFRPTAKFVNIEKVPRSRSIKIFEFFSVRRLERRVHETYPETPNCVKYFIKDGPITENMPVPYNHQKVSSPKKIKDKQMDRRFWKQLSKRRGNKSSFLPA